jgi:hypothetical protein
MLDIKKSFIVDDQNKKVGVQLDIDTFNKIEETLENYALFHLIQDNADDEALSVNEAKAYYNHLEKSP